MSPLAVCVAVGCSSNQPATPPVLGRYECHSGLPLGAFTLLDRDHYTAYDPYRDATSAGTYVWMGSVIEFRSGRDQGVRLRRMQGRATVGSYALPNAAGKPIGVICSPES